MYFIKKVQYKDTVQLDRKTRGVINVCQQYTKHHCLHGDTKISLVGKTEDSPHSGDRCVQLKTPDASYTDKDGLQNLAEADIDPI